MPHPQPERQPHHFELMAFKTNDPTEDPHRCNVGQTVEDLIDHMLFPIVDGLTGKLLQHADSLKRRGYRYWEIRPVYLTARQQDALWAQNPPLQMIHPIKDYD